MNMTLSTGLARVRTAALVALTLCLTFLATGTSTAQADEDLLAPIDTAINRWTTLDYKYNIVTKDADDNISKLKLRMRMRRKGGENQQFVNISKPADMKGTKVLTLSPTEMYIYIPSFKKIRRIASHVTEAGFLGTTLSQKDLTLTRYGKYYTAVKKSEDDDNMTLKLTAKDDSAPYPSLELVIMKKRQLPREIRYFNAEGVKIKTEKRSSYKCKNNYCAPMRMTMTDHTANKKTVLQLRSNFKVNKKIKKGLFSKRSLK
jgi:hypothetical protein